MEIPTVSSVIVWSDEIENLVEVDMTAAGVPVVDAVPAAAKTDLSGVVVALLAAETAAR